jgi:ABC-type glycerol-3-phosphate transport system permease component
VEGVRAARPWLVSLLAALSVVYVIPAIMFYVIARRALQSSLAGGLAGT